VLSVTMLGVLLVLLFWGVIMLGFMGPFAPQPEAFDLAVAEFALALRNDLTDPVMVALSQLSRWQVIVVAAIAVLLWLLGAGQISAAGHWLVAIGGGALIQTMLAWGLRATPQVIAVGNEPLPGPSSAMGLATVVLAFLPSSSPANSAATTGIFRTSPPACCWCCCSWHACTWGWNGSAAACSA
jgi:hypothetical protein